LQEQAALVVAGATSCAGKADALKAFAAQRGGVRGSQLQQQQQQQDYSYYVDSDFAEAATACPSPNPCCKRRLSDANELDTCEIRSINCVGSSTLVGEMVGVLHGQLLWLLDTRTGGKRDILLI
jgi:hypothetical protein